MRVTTRVCLAAWGRETVVVAWIVGVVGAGVDRCTGGGVACDVRWCVTGLAVVGAARGAVLAGVVGVVVTAAADDGVVAVVGEGVVAVVDVVLVTAVGGAETTGAVARS